MAYLSEADFTLFISKENLDEILTQAAGASGKTNDQVLQFAQSYASAYIISMLGGKYNIVAEFAMDNTSGTRDMLLLGVLVELTLCVIHKTINPRDIPELREKACEDAKAWLKDVRNGDAVLGLGIVLNPDPLSQRFTIINSQVKFISKPYADAGVIGNQNRPYPISGTIPEFYL